MNDEGCGLTVILLIALFGFGFLLGLSLHDGEPEAIDVYRGKTTLQITYQDSVAVDSVVVFKDKENKI